MKAFNIIKEKAFCLAGHDLGIATSTFASQAWKISDETFREIMGVKFGWIGPDGENYVDHRDIMKRPTPEQINKLMTEKLLKVAVEKGYVELIN